MLMCRKKNLVDKNIIRLTDRYTSPDLASLGELVPTSRFNNKKKSINLCDEWVYARSELRGETGGRIEVGEHG